MNNMVGVSFAIGGNSRKRRRGQVAPVESDEPLNISGPGFVDYEDDPSDSDGSVARDAPRGGTMIDTIHVNNSSSGPFPAGRKSGDDAEQRTSFPVSGLQTDKDSSNPSKKTQSQIARLIERRRIDRDAFQLDEEASFRHDIKQCAEASQPEDYAKLPVESFGSSLLKAMGWDGKPDDKDKGVHFVKPRQSLLGLGARAHSQIDKSTRKRFRVQRREADKQVESQDPHNRCEALVEDDVDEGSGDKVSHLSRLRFQALGTKSTAVPLDADKGHFAYSTSECDGENEASP
jgi:G-patch domain